MNERLSTSKLLNFSTYNQNFKYVVKFMCGIKCWFGHLYENQ